MGKVAPFVDTELYPPSASAQGNNAYYHRCEVVEQTTPYASCLSKIKQRKEGRLPSAYAPCSAAINQGRCIAVEMQQKEMLEGRAVFFINRAKQIAHYTPEATEIKGPTKPTKWNQSPPKQQVFAPSGNQYADALNFAMQNKTAPAQASKPTPTIAVLSSNVKGLTLMEIARLRTQNAN